MRLGELRFKRRFSVNPYKTLRLKTGEMSMYKDWVNDKRGDPYTVLAREGDVAECVDNAEYRVRATEGGRVERLISSFFPIYSYEATLTEIGGDTGFNVRKDGRQVSIMLIGGKTVEITAENEKYTFNTSVEKGDTFSVTFRQGGVSVYVDKGARPVLIGDASVKALEDFSRYEVFTGATVSLVTSLGKGGEMAYKGVNAYLCGGLSHADMKPMKYEDGTPIIENGRVYMTMSSRLEVGCYQSVISWEPTTCEMKLEGAILYDIGDGICASDVAASVVYDRNAKKWYIWYCSFSHGHILARGVIKGDPRFGVQIVDAELLPLWSGSDRREFAGVPGDEDPDLCFIDGKWNLTVCRIEDDKAYHYYRFTSDSPLDGFTYADRTPTGGKTGGMMTPFEGKYYFVCGTDFGTRANYDIYPYNNFSEREKPICDYDDGGFRGWGTVFGMYVGSRKRYYWMTFDRHNASKWNWSYGNIHVYEAEQWFK